jgi:hypothetical protein
MEQLVLLLLEENAELWARLTSGQYQSLNVDHIPHDLSALHADKRFLSWNVIKR